MSFKQFSEVMLEVFSEVKAVLSSYVVNSIKENLEDVILNHVKTANLEKITRENEMQFFLCGTLEGIISAQNKIIEFLSNVYKESEADVNLPSVQTYKENYELSDITEVAKESEVELEEHDHGLQQILAVSSLESEDSTVAAECEIARPLFAPRRSVRKTNIVLKERIKNKIRRSLKSSKWLFKKEQIRSTPAKPDCIRKNPSDIPCENLKCSDAELLHVSEGECHFADSGCSEKGLDQKDRKDYEATSPFKHFCNLCSFKTKRISHFKKHMEIHEKVSTLFKCSQCSFTSVRLSHLRRHEMTHSSTVHKCSQCHYTTDDRKFLTRHVRLKHRGQCSDKKSFPILNCPQCPYKTTKQHFYDRHKKMHGYDKKISLYQCEQCKYKTLRKEHYVRHVNNVHGDKRPYLCHLCGKAFKRGDALQQHHLTHVDSKVPDSTSFKCSVCDKSFRSQSHLFEHKAVHSEIRSFLCEICGASFKTRSVQRKHVLTIHRNPRAYSCESCSRRFNTLYALKRHSKIHESKNGVGQELDADNCGITASVQNSASEPKSVYVDCVSHDVTVAATPLQVTLSSTDSTLPHTESVSVKESVQTVIPSTEVLTNVTSTFIQTSETATALLYLTNGYATF